MRLKVAYYSFLETVVQADCLLDVGIMCANNWYK